MTIGSITRVFEISIARFLIGKSQKNASALCATIAAAALLNPTVAWGQTFPNKPFRFIVPYSAGAAPDTLTRAFSQELTKATGQSVIIENKVGADGVIAFDFVANQMPADGYTLLLAAGAGLATLPLTAKNLRFDPLKDLPPVVGLVEGKYIFSIPALLPYKSFNELIAYVRANPGKTNYGSSNSTIRLQSEALFRGLGLSVVHVPYRASSNYLIGIANNEVQMGFTSEGSILGIGARARILGVTGETRSTHFPDAPTFAELGLPEIRGLTYWANVRAGTPKPIFDRLETLITQAMRTPEMRAVSQKLGLDPVALPSAVAAKRLLDEARVFANVAKQIGLQPE